MKTSIIFKLVLEILSYHVFFLLLRKIFNPTSKLAIPIGIPTKEAKAETKTHPVIEEAKVSRCSI